MTLPPLPPEVGIILRLHREDAAELIKALGRWFEEAAASIVAENDQLRQVVLRLQEERDLLGRPAAGKKPLA